MTAQEAQEYGIIDQVFTKENRTVSPNTPCCSADRRTSDVPFRG